MREYTAGNILSQFNNISGTSWREKIVDITGGANDVSFVETMPNVFIIQNTSGNELKVSLSGVATAENYEFKVPANTTKPVGSPIPKGQISIFNTSNNKFTLRIFSVSAPLDLSIFNETNVKMEGANIETDGLVKGFASGVQLPAGNNTIGAVELASSTKQNVNDITTYLETLVNGANLKNLLTELQLLNTFIGSLVAKDSNETYTGLKDLINAVTNKNTYCESVEATVTSSSPVNIVKDIRRIAYISNDGTNTATATLVTAEGSKVFTIKAGEVLTDIKCYSTQLTVTGSSVPIRVAVEYEA